jgi:class 3 adenylate cyclase
VERPPVPDDRDLARATAPAVATTSADPELRSLPAPGAERRQLTVLFCDLVGSTALSERLDPEDLREVMYAYHRCCAEVIARSGGFVARHMGDGVLAYFGYPRAHENDAERAGRAGLALVEAVKALAIPETTGLHVRVGIATGMVVAGNLFGDQVAHEHGVVGGTPNLAAGLQALAEPDAVVIADRTRRLTGGLFDYRDLGTVALKNVGEPVQAWQLLGPSVAESRFAAHHGAELAPMVGRAQELETLQRRWEQVTAGHGQVVLVSGEAGIGKSRLTAALTEWLQAEPHLRLRYSCSPHDSDSALFPVIGQLERAAGFERTDPPAQRLVKLDALLRQCSADPRHVALLADLLLLPGEGRDRPRELSPQQRKEQTFAALLAQLEGLATQHPVLMIWEDVHWIDPTSLEVLALAVERVAHLRVLLLIAARPEFSPRWPIYAHAATLTLSRLDRREGTALVEQVTGGRPLPEEVTRQILARADGCAALYRGADQGGDRDRRLAQARRAICSRPLAAALGDTSHLARFIGRPARPLVLGTRRGANRRRHRPRILLRAAERGGRHGGGGAARRAASAHPRRAHLLPRRTAAGELQLQARAGGGCRLFQRAAPAGATAARAYRGHD